MCTPLAFVQALGAAVGFFGDKKNARAQARFQEYQQTVTREQAIANMVNEQAALAARENQEIQSASQAARDLRRQADRARGVIAASSGSVAGPSVDALLRDFELQESVQEQVIRVNLRNTQQQIQLQREGSEAAANRRIFSAVRSDVQTPSLFSGILQIGTAAVGGYLNSTYVEGGNTYSIFTNKRIN